MKEEDNMDGKNLLSMEQLTAVLDNAPVAVYVSAVESWELLYVNSLAKDLLSKLDIEGSICYRAAGFEEPCPFCRANELSDTELLTREFQHPVNKGIYQLSGKIIDWEGIPAHIEYILDITEKTRQEEQRQTYREQLQETFTSIPCGLGVYQFDGKKIAPLFHNPAFYEIMGYSEEHAKSTQEATTFLGVHPDDLEQLQKEIHNAIQSKGVMQHTYRIWNDQVQDYAWIRLEGSVKSSEDGNLLLYGVYSDVSEQKHLEKDLFTAKEEMDYLINSIPGGIASYRVEGDRFIPVFFSDGARALSGHTRDEYRQMCKYDVFDAVYEPDRERVKTAVKSAFASGKRLQISYRMEHKSGGLIWVHLNGRRMGSLTDTSRFYVVITGLSAEAQLFQSMTNGTADGIYVIDQKNYDLLYTNEPEDFFPNESGNLGEKCYTALFGKYQPCEFCILGAENADGMEHEMVNKETGKHYSTRFRALNWNGIPAYVKYVREITAEVHTRKEKERLEEYFKTLVSKIPGGISVVSYETNGNTSLQFVSDGLIAMTRMTLEEIKNLCQNDIFAGVHPDDQIRMRKDAKRFVRRGEGSDALTGRIKRGDGSYIWVKITLSLLKMTDEVRRIYCVYTDITKTVMEKEQIRRQYEELILQHYRAPSPNALVIGHCNITRNKILDILDYTDSNLLKCFGDSRQGFFRGISGLVVDPKEQKVFLDTFLNEPSMAAFLRNEPEQIVRCFIKLPADQTGRYAQFKVHMVETPDTGDITGILAVTDTTEQVISDRIMNQLSRTSHDVIMDFDLNKDKYLVLSYNKDASYALEEEGRLSEWVSYMIWQAVVPKDRKQYAKGLDPNEMRQRLTWEDAYTFAFSIMNEKGDIRTKNMTVSRIDMRLGRVCLMCTDITDSVREQQGLLNMAAYTFELMGLVSVRDDRLVMYTRQVVLESLAPYTIENYNDTVSSFTDGYISEEGKESVQQQFRMETMVQRLKKEPGGYDVVLPYREENKGELRYKQISILWGDQEHNIICIVRADVTDMLAAERQVKTDLKEALELAEEASLAKSNFLSAMSHDIRTPMNAIMGMTTLAIANLNDRERIEDCLQKITIASRHLLSLINDVLDMSRIERSKITLSNMKIFLPELIGQITAIMEPQAIAAGLQFHVDFGQVSQKFFYGDSLRINQILINILSNAVKFTPKNGTVDFIVEQVTPYKSGQVRYRFTIGDTGIGMPQEFLEDIFAPFVRSNRSSRTEGTGLGLSITKGLVDLMEGEISVESQVDKGSIFQVELEYDIAYDENRIFAATTGDGCSYDIFTDCCFLIAEDNEINAEILSELLFMHGATSVVKTNGVRAVQEFQETVPGTYDAILMDIQMPEMNGYEATRFIRKMDRPDAADIPIVAMTADAFAEDIQASLEAGMNAHVSKPIDLDVLRETLRRVLDR